MHIPTFTTFSIVARDKTTGEIAVAGTTNWFAYGKKVPYAKAGIGAVATQAATHIPYAIDGLKLLKTKTAKETLHSLMKHDPDIKGEYQVLIIDNKGNTAGHTGENNLFFADHLTENNVAFAGNYLANNNVLVAMQKYYHTAKEPFGLKIIKTLQAGQKAGGDIRGKKSAALKVVKKDTSTQVWADTLLDLQIDDHATPLKELERLYFVAESFNAMNNAAATENYHKRIEFIKKAITIYPQNTEAYFWLADAYWELGEKEKAIKTKEKFMQLDSKHWEDLWKRIREKNGKNKQK